MFNKPVVTNFGNKYGNNRWIVKSQKIQREVYLFSDLEYDNWILVESDPNIKFFCEQPTIIESTTAAKKATTIPDMYILYKDGRESIREIKYQKEMHSDRVQQQIAIQKEWCESNNYVHEIMTDTEIRKNKLLLSNFKILSKVPLLENAYLEQQIKSSISKHPNKILKITNEIISSTPINIDSEDIQMYIFGLIKSGEVSANLEDMYLGPYMEVYLDD